MMRRMTIRGPIPAAANSVLRRGLSSLVLLAIVVLAACAGGPHNGFPYSYERYPGPNPRGGSQ
jgi:hypothetical protein